MFFHDLNKNSYQMKNEKCSKVLDLYIYKLFIKNISLPLKQIQSCKLLCKIKFLFPIDLKTNW